MNDLSSLPLPDPLYAELDLTNTVVLALYANPQPSINNVVQIDSTDSRIITFLKSSEPKTILPINMINRFSTDEQKIIMTAAQSNWEVLMWLTQFNMCTIIDIADQDTINRFNFLVKKNLITQDRMNCILNLHQSSP